MLQQRLYAAPEPLFLELPSSWLPRVALSQAETLNAVKRFLRFPKEGDVDLKFLAMQPAGVAMMCGFDAGIFDETDRVLNLALSLDMRHPILLYDGETPRYRFCVECLKGLRTPYFPLHWRFDVYRMCETHQSLLEDTCPHCGATVCPLRATTGCGPDHRGRAFASQCSRCSRFLWDMMPLKINTIPRRLFSKHDRTRLSNGGSFIVALMKEWVLLPDHDETDVRIALPLAERRGMFASGTELKPSYFRKHMSAKVSGQQ